MMLRNKVILPFFFLASVIALVWSCQEDDFIPLKINSVSPSLALVGDTITIFGEGFSQDYAVNRIYFPSVKKYVAPINGSTTSKLIVPVPDGATSGSIRINILADEVFDSPSITITPPIFESIIPNTGYVGDTIIIKGDNFQAGGNDRNHVKFTGAAVDNFPPAVVISSTRTELKVIVPNDTKPGNISVLGFQGPKFGFKIGKITSVFPTKGVVGDIITVTGLGFVPSGSSELYFNPGVEAPLALSAADSALLNNSFQRKIVVPADASNGKLRLTYISGTKEVTILSDSIFQIYPSITGLSSITGPPGYPLAITGYSFAPKRAPSVNVVTASINGVAVTVKSFDNQNINVTIPASATSGQVKVIVNGRVALGPEFQVSAAGTPVIESLSKTEGFVGDEVIINGQGFNPNIDDNTVKIGTVKATIKAATATSLTITIPAGATTNTVNVTSNGIAAVGELRFTVKIPVINFEITSVTPSVLKQDAPISIKGSGFSTAGDISPFITPKFESPSYRFTDMDFTATEIKGAAFTYHDPNQGQPPAYMPGAYALTIRYNATPTEDASNPVGISIQGLNVPKITSISPNEAKPGVSITIQGVDFNGDGSKNTVTFTGASTAAAIYVAFDRPSPLNTNGSLTVKVPDLPPGDYNVTVNNGVGQETNTPFVFKIKPEEVVTIEPKPVYYLGKEGSGISLNKITKDLVTPTKIFSTDAGGITSMVFDLKADITASKVYFSQFSSDESLNDGIFSMKLDGLAKTRIVKTKPPDGDSFIPGDGLQIYDLSLDVSGNRIFWTFVGSSLVSEVLTSKTNTPPASLTNPESISKLGNKFPYSGGLSYSDGIIYTAPGLDDVDGNTVSHLLRVNVSTKTFTTLYDEGDELGRILDVKIDRDGNSMYLLTQDITDYYNHIVKANLDGTNKVTLVDFDPNTSVLGISLDLKDKYIYYMQIKNSQSSIGVVRMDGELIPGTGDKTQIVYSKNLSFDASSSGAGSIAVEEGTGGSAAGRMGSMNMQLKYRLKKRK